VSTLTFAGNQKFGDMSYSSAAETVCPAGSYFDAEKNCPYCPVGFTCPGGDKIIPCGPSEWPSLPASYVLSHALH